MNVYSYVYQWKLHSSSLRKMGVDNHEVTKAMETSGNVGVVSNLLHKNRRKGGVCMSPTQKVVERESFAPSL